MAWFFKWRAKYSGMDASKITQMKSVEDTKYLLMCMFADLQMQADLLNCDDIRHRSERT